MIYFSLKFFVIQLFGIILYNFYMLTILLILYEGSQIFWEHRISTYIFPFFVKKLWVNIKELIAVSIWIICHE